MSDDLDDARSRYEPATYWTKRLGNSFNLRGVGHVRYSEGYNAWIYRQKGRAVDRVLPPVPDGGRALDVGSGVGWVVDHLRRRGWHTDGCDISDLAVERLRARFSGSSFSTFAFGADRLPAKDGTYDLVTMLDVTYHVVDDGLWSAGLEELRRVLKPGGALVFIDRFGEADDDVAAHVRFRSMDRWETTTAPLGLRRDAVVPAYRWISRPRDSGLLSRVPDAVRGPLEYALEPLVPREPHLRAVRFLAV